MSDRFRKLVLDPEREMTIGSSAGTYTPANGAPVSQEVFRTVYLDANVPCDGCVECCKGPNVVFLREGDDPSLYQLRMVSVGSSEVPALDVKPNGDCLYLGDEGCTIHGHRPGFCRGFDCRVGIESDLIPMRIRKAAAALIERTTGEVVDLDEPQTVPVASHYILSPEHQCEQCKGRGTRLLQWNDPLATPSEVDEWRATFAETNRLRHRLGVACQTLVDGVFDPGKNILTAFSFALRSAVAPTPKALPVKCGFCNGTGSITG